MIRVSPNDGQPLRCDLRSFGVATVEAVGATLAVCSVLYPTAGVLHDLVGAPLPTGWLDAAAVLVAIGLAFPSSVADSAGTGW